MQIYGDYHQLVRELGRRFGRKDTPSAARRELMRIKQTVYESMANWSQRVHFIAMNGHPGASAETVHQIAVDVFLRGCKEKRAAEEGLRQLKAQLATMAVVRDTASANRIR